MCQTCGDSPPDFFRAEWRRAAKRHLCEECKKFIEKRARYRYIVQKINMTQEVVSTRLCERCERDWKWLTRLVGQKDRQSGPMRQRYEIKDHVGDIEEAVREAVEDSVITARHPLARKWLPKAS